MVSGQPTGTRKLIEIDHLPAADGDPSSLITALPSVDHRGVSTTPISAGSYVISCPWKSRLDGLLVEYMSPKRFEAQAAPALPAANIDAPQGATSNGQFEHHATVKSPEPVHSDEVGAPATEAHLLSET